MFLSRNNGTDAPTLCSGGWVEGRESQEGGGVRPRVSWGYFQSIIRAGRGVNTADSLPPSPSTRRERVSSISRGPGWMEYRGFGKNGTRIDDLIFVFCGSSTLTPTKAYISDRWFARWHAPGPLRECATFSTGAKSSRCGGKMIKWVWDEIARETRSWWSLIYFFFLSLFKKLNLRRERLIL